jgi:hypothetical protein
VKARKLTLLARHRKGVLALAAAVLGLIALTVGAADAAAPTVTVGAASQVGVTSALAKGTVNPEEKETNCRFDYIAAAQFGQNPSEPFEGAAQAPCTGNPLNGNTPQPVEAVLAGLAPATTYHLRLVAENSEGEHAEESAPTFETAPATAPTPAVTGSSEVRYTEAKIEGTIDPHGGNANPIEGTLPIGWQLQYAPTAEGEPHNWQNAGAEGENPIEGAPAEASTPIALSAKAEGLANATEYAFRLIATYAGGLEATSAQGTFTTLAVAKPTITVDPVTTFTDSSATFVGHLNPNALQAEGSTSPAEQAAFETSWHFECVAPGPSCRELSGATVPAGNAAREVSAAATELEPNKPYYVVLVASNLGGKEEATTAAQPSFTTSQAEPTALATTNTPESGSTVLLRGVVDPRNSTVTDCHFAWGPASGGFESSAPCVGNAENTEPPVPAPIAGGEPQLVTARLSGLSGGFSGHFEVVITTTGGGPVVSEPVPFVTFAAPESESCPNQARREEQDPGGFSATNLPECRAYELVSPAQKNGAEISAVSRSTRAAVDGEAAEFSSLQAFADTRATAVAAPYIAERDATPGTQGWVTHGILPRLQPGTPVGVGNGHDSLYEGEFSPDLDKGVLATQTPLTSDPETSEVGNLYLREDLLSPGAESTRLLTSCPACAESDPAAPLSDPLYRYQPLVAGASADLGQIVFQANRNLTADAPAEPSCAPPFFLGCHRRLYESDHGTLRLVGRIPPPGGTECDDSGAVHCVGAAISEPGNKGIGPGAAFHYSSTTISGDGRKVFFTVPDGSGFEAPGHIYMRLDHTSTVQIDASERTACLEGHESCQPSQPARLEAVSPDGSRVFFNDPGRLTNEPCAFENYVYDTTKAASDPHNLSCLEPRYEGAPELRGAIVIGTSSNGNWAYGMVRGTHTGTTPFGGPPPPGGSAVDELFVWHEGRVRPIGSIFNVETVSNNPWSEQTFEARVASGGGALLFVSGQGRWLTGQTNAATCPNGAACRQLYLYRADTGSLTCVSCAPSGSAVHSPAGDAAQFNLGAAQLSGHWGRPLTADGDHVFFETAEPLVPEDTDGTSDVYGYDAADGSVHLISSGTSPDESHFLEATPDGGNVFFSTSQSLVGWDTNAESDLYDARTGGGFPEPPAVPAPCEGAAGCRTTVPAPGAGSPASQGFSGPGNPKPGKACPKGKVKKHGRCVGKKAGHKKHPRHNKSGKHDKSRAGSGRGGHR